jgi:hypothetical protein
MKKLIAISVVFALIAGAAFAQTANGISVNAWGRGAFSPLVNVGAPKAGGTVQKDEEGNDLKSSSFSGASTTWGWNGNRIRTDFRINGNAEFIGFTVEVNEGGIGGDNMYIWAKPFSNDILKLSVGHFYVDNLRGKVDTDTGFENFVLSDLSADKIFTRFQGSQGDGVFVNQNGPNGYMLSSAPVDGLFIGLLVNGGIYGFNGWPGEGSVGGVPEDHPTRIIDAFRFMQAGFGYDIADIGHIRAQWLGGWFGTVNDDKLEDQGIKFDVGPDVGKTGRIEAAFALTAIQNLMLDLGFKFWLPLSDESNDQELKASNGIEVGLGARFRADAFQIVAQIHSIFGKYNHSDSNDKSANGVDLAVNLLPSYDLDFGTLGASIGLRVGGKSKNYAGEAVDGTNTMQVGFGAYLKKGLGSGSVQAGLAYKLAPMADGKANGSNVFSIPIILEYAFF